MKFKFTISICACLIFLSVNNAHAKFRLTAATNCYSNGGKFVPNDSSTFVYSGYRGGGLTFSTYGWTPVTNCDTTYLNYYISHTGNYYQSSRTINSYDSHDNLLTQLYQYYDTAHSLWYNVSLYTNTYDANNNQLISTAQLWDTTGGSGGIWKNINRHSKAYDTYNNNIADTGFSWHSGTWQITQLQAYTYDSYNYLLSSIISYAVSGTLTNNFKTSYSLNAGHKPDSTVSYLWSTSLSAWQYYQKDIYTYDASYNMLMDTSLFWSNLDTVWQPSFLYLYTYSGADVATKEAKFFNTTTGWRNNSKDNMTYDASHNLLTVITQYWRAYKSAYDNYNKADNVYNSDNLVTNYTTTAWDSASASWKLNMSSQQSRFYYESYTGLAAGNIKNLQATLKVFPCPANNYINLELNNTNNKSFTMAIYDLNGRLYKQWQAQTTGSYHATIPTDNLPAGNYIIEMRNDSGQSVEQFSIVH